MLVSCSLTEAYMSIALRTEFPVFLALTTIVLGALFL